MKKMLSFLLLLFLACSNGLGLSNRKSYDISAVSNPQYRTFNISEAIKRLLFIRFKGNLTLPENGYFIDLSENDARRIGAKTIAYIPLDGETYFEDEPKKIKTTVEQLSPDTYLFYSTKNTTRTSTLRKDFFQNPSLQDTIPYSEITYGENLENTSEWIEMLDNHSQVVVLNIGCAETPDGGHSLTSYDKTKMCDLAKSHLHYVTNLWPETSDEWNKKQWKSWFSNLMSFKEPTEAECNTEVWNQERYFNPSYIYSGYYYTDAQTNIIARVEALPSYEKYKNQQVIFFDQKQNSYFIYDLHTEKYPFNESIRGFVFRKKHIYILTESIKWVEFAYNKEKDRYQKIGQKELLPETFRKRVGRVNVVDTYYNDNVYFMLLESTSKQYYLSCFKTQTGELIGIKPFSEIIGKTELGSLRNIRFEKLKYCNNDQNYWVLALKKKNDESFFLKVNPELDQIACIKSGVKLDWYEYILTTDSEIIHVRNFSGDLQRRIYDTKLSCLKQTLRTDITDEKDQLLDQDYIVKDGNSIRVIVDFLGKYNSGIKQKKVGIYDNSVEESCVYSDIPYEELSSENEKTIFYVGRNNITGWTVFMKDENVLRIANVK